MVAPNTTTQRRKVVIPTGVYLPAYLGGEPIQTLKALIEESPEGFDTRVICANHDLGESDPLVDRPNEWHPVGRAEVRYVGGGWKDLLAAFRATSDADLIYLNSLFDPSYSVLSLVPRGELYPGTLAQKATKKRIFLKAFRTLGLANRVTWHASTKDEAVQIREHFGDDQRIVVRENETPLPREAVPRGARPDGLLQQRRSAVASVAVQASVPAPLLVALQFIPDALGVQLLGETWHVAALAILSMSIDSIFSMATRVAILGHRVNFGAYQWGVVGAAWMMAVFAIISAVAWWIRYWDLSRRQAKRRATDVDDNHISDTISISS